MIPELARMAVVLKSQHATSVMTGNYELGYTCGLLSKLSGRQIPQWTAAKELQDYTLQTLAGYEPADDREKTIMRMLKLYHPDETMDDQVKELFEMGKNEQHVWQVNMRK